MSATRSPLVAAIFLVAAFAGCAGDDPTKAAFVATPLDPGVLSKYRFDAGPSTGPGLKFEWDFGDTTAVATTKVVEHTYTYLNGEYTVTLKVTDSAGQSDVASQKVQVGAGTNNEPILFAKADQRWVKPGDEIMFDATQTYDDDGDPLRFIWDFNSPFSDDEYRSLENLGTQQYGVYANGPPRNDTEGTGESGMTPSGHDWVTEVEKARMRWLARVGITGLDPGHGAPKPPEPRNPEVDGRISDTSPIQFFSYPEGPDPATYYVTVRAVDVKGTFVDGYIRIRVSSAPPPTTQTKSETDVALQSGALEGVADQTNANTRTMAGVSYTLPYPAVARLTVNFVESPSGAPGTKEMSAILCYSSAVPVGTCDQAARSRLAAGATGRSIDFKMGPENQFPNAATLWILNKGQAPVKASTSFKIDYDINPWAQEECGCHTGH